MATISNTPRPGFAWDSTDNVWYPIGTGTHSHADIPNTIVTAKGDIVTATASATPARVGVGTDKFVLGADSTAGTGLAWQSSPQSLMTTTGDSIYASAANTPARLGIGTTGQVLTVASGLPSWATPSSGSLVLINTTAFSASTNVSIDTLFSATYYHYLILVNCTGTANSDLNYRLRASGTDNSTANYNQQVLDVGGTTVAASRNTSQTNGRISGLKTSSAYIASMTTLFNPFATLNTNQVSTGVLFSDASIAQNNITGGFNATTSFTGISIFPGSGNITGSISIYGYAK